VLRERPQNLLLRCERCGRPLPLLRVGCVSAGARNALSERRCPEHDDLALPDVDLRPGAAREPAPGSGGRGERRLGRHGPAGPEDECQRAERDDDERRHPA